MDDVSEDTVVEEGEMEGFSEVDDNGEVVDTDVEEELLPLDEEEEEEEIDPERAEIDAYLEETVWGEDN